MEVKTQFGELGLQGNIILKCILRKRVWTDSSGLG
jgi:hypothetical protein